MRQRELIPEIRWCTTKEQWLLSPVGLFVTVCAVILITGWLYCVECHNTVFGSKRSAICAGAVYFLHSMMPSVMCLRPSDVDVICRVAYFQFPIQVWFSSMSVRQATQRRIGLHNIGRFRKFGYVPFLYAAYIPGEWFWIDSNNKVETRHPVEDYFGSEFYAICNHCVVMAAWSRKACKFVEEFLQFFWKNNPLQ